MVNDANIDDLLALREPAFTATAPLLKTVSAGGYSLGIDETASIVADSLVVASTRSASIKATYLTAINSGGLGIFAAGGVIAFAIDNSSNCKVFKDLAIVGGLSVSGVASAPTIRTTAIKAIDSGGISIVTKDGLNCFAVQDDLNCRAFQDLRVDRDLTVQGVVKAPSLRTSDIRLLSLDGNSLSIQRFFDGDPNIPNGWHTLSRFDLSAIYGGSLFVDNIAADIAGFVRIVSPCQTEQGLHVKGDITCDGSIQSPFHCAGKVDGSNLAVTVSKGTSAFTITRPDGRPTGIYHVAFTTPHPDGAEYVVQLTVQVFNCTIKVWEFSTFVPNANGFHVVILNSSNAVTDAAWHFSVIA